MKKYLAPLALVLSAVAVEAQAVAPAWVETSITAFKTDMSDILLVAVPLFLSVIALFVAPRVIAGFMRRAAK